MAEHGLTPANVAKMEARVPAVEAHVVDNREMPDICLQHLLALLLTDGGLSFENTHDYARMEDPQLRALREKIVLVSDAALPRRAGKLAVERTDGAPLSYEVIHVRGTAANPMTEDEVAAKAGDLMEPILGAARTGELIAAILALETVDDCRDLRRLLSA